MSTTILEKYTSRRITTGPSASRELLYTVLGSDDEDEVLAAVQAEAPTTFGGLPRQSVRVEAIAPEVWDGEAVYAANQPGGGSGPAEVGDSVVSFDTTGGTQRITQSKETIASYARAGETAKDFNGAIGVTDDTVEGTDVVVPVYAFAETHYIDAATVTPTFRATLRALTGRVNDDAFRGSAAGEVLFLGATGTRRGGPDGEDYEITYRFAESQNATGLVVGAITGIVKKGWDYLWARYEEEEDAGGLGVIPQPVAAYVERVYEEGDFSLLGIGVL